VENEIEIQGDGNISRKPAGRKKVFPSIRRNEGSSQEYHSRKRDCRGICQRALAALDDANFGGKTMKPKKWAVGDRVSIRGTIMILPEYSGAYVKFDGNRYDTCINPDGLAKARRLVKRSKVKQSLINKARSLAKEREELKAAVLLLNKHVSPMSLYANDLIWIGRLVDRLKKEKP
jgi:predicted RNA-binding protein with RPS1 domain